MSKISLKRRFSFVPPAGGAVVGSVSLHDKLGEAIDRWLYRVKLNSVKPSTFARLRGSYNLLIKYNVAYFRMMDLRTDDLQKFINQLVLDGYGMSTIKKAYNLLTAFLTYAIGDGLAIHPIHFNLSLPKESNLTFEKRDVTAYDDSAQLRLRRVCEQVDDTSARAIIILLETGMRIGELMALDWSDILWSRRAVHIHKTLVDLNNKGKAYVQDTPKTKKGNRTIPLSSKALSTLRKMFEAQEAPSGLIFNDGESDTTIGYNGLSDGCKSLCELAGVEWRGFHVLRHTFATNCYYRGCDVKKLSQLLGHSTVTITYQIYINLFGDCLEELRSIVE